MTQPGVATDGDELRLHCNENPYGPPPAAIDAAAQEVRDHCPSYPDSEATALRQAVADHHDTRPEMVAVGNGVDELILAVTLALSGPGRQVLVTDSTFPGYLASARIAGATVVSQPLADYRVPVDAVVEHVRSGVGLAYVCNPHNPTGAVLTPSEVERILVAGEQAGAVVVFDEAYMEFAGPAYEHAVAAVRDGRRLVVLRTFSKAWGLASLRVGYALAPADLIAEVHRVQQALPFRVNRMAQRAAVAALDHAEHIGVVRERNAAARESLCRGLAAIGVEHVPSAANFVLVKVAGDSTEVAARLAADHRVLVRDLAMFGLPGHLRVTVGAEDDVSRFCTALERVLGRDQLSAGLGSPPLAVRVPTLEPVRPAALFNGYVGANAVFALNQLGVLDRLADGPATVAGLAADAGANAGRLLTLLRVAALLGYVELAADETVTMTDTGRELVAIRGYFTWCVGGYGAVLRGLTDLTTGEAVFERDVNRDGRLVAKGSGEAGRSVMLPVEQEVLATVSYGSVADLGCGDANRLIRLCGSGSGRRGVGIEANQAACDLARKRISDAGAADSVEIVHADVLGHLRERRYPGIELVSSFLMLHDLFNETGDPAAVVRTLRAAFPDAKHFLIGDTVAQNWAEMPAPLPPFSMGFELVHAFMDTPIIARDTYESAFAAAGLRIERREALGAPSTWLWLLSVE